jgi:hypothetical protein
LWGGLVSAIQVRFSWPAFPCVPSDAGKLMSVVKVLLTTTELPAG